MAMMGEVHHPAFGTAVAAAVECHSLRVLEPRLMRQLYQAVTSARILGLDCQVPAELEGTAYKWWEPRLETCTSINHHVTDHRA